MAYSYQIRKSAASNLQRFDAKVRRRLLNKINWLVENVSDLQHERLAGDLNRFFRLRVGDYRILYDIDEDEEIVYIERIGHRSNVYDD